MRKSNHDSRKPLIQKTSRTSPGQPFPILLAALFGLLSLGRAPVQAAPAQHDVAAGNINVIQNDTSNNVASVTLTLPLSINDLRLRPGSNRGDYNLQIGDIASDDAPSGVLITSVTENGRDNYEASGLTFAATAMDAVSGGTITNGYWVVAQDGTSARAEYNINCAVAYFPASTWLGGWARNSGATNGGVNNLLVGSPGLTLGTHFVDLGGGRSTVDLRSLGLDSTRDGVLLVNHGKNEGNFALSQVNTNGTWSLFVKDNFANGTAYEQDPVAFVFIPKSKTTVISGRFQGDGTILLHSSTTPAFAIAPAGVGAWRLTIPGYTPAQGVLILSAEGGLTMNGDNLVSYKPDADGWIIESRDITGDAAQPLPVLETPLNEPVASFVFIPAEAPVVTGPLGPGHDVGAIRLEVLQNDTANTEASVTVTNAIAINGLSLRSGSNRGDFNLQVGDDPSDDATHGVLIPSITQNGRDNDEGTGLQYATSAMDALLSGSTAGGFWIPTGDCTSNRAEYNINSAAAYFPYNSWVGGWVRNSTAANGGPNDLLTGSTGLSLGTHFINEGGGRSTVDLRPLGIVSGSDGVLLVTQGKNEGNFCLSQVNTNGTWSVFVKDNFGNGTAYEQDPVAFVFIPRTTTSVISGRFQGDGTILLHSGAAPAFAITNTAVGTWRLTIPGYSPTNGVLILSPEGGLTANNDNVVSYQAEGDGWIIESRDITGDNAQPLPVLETPTNEPVASFVFIPAVATGVSEPPGLVVTPFAPISVLEGAKSTYSLKLATQPTANVVITANSGNPGKAILSPSTLTFTPFNWSAPQTVTVTAPDDFVADGNASYILTNRVTSTDPRYAALPARNLGATTVDNEASLSLNSQDSFYSPGQPAVGLDGRATLMEPDSAEYAGGSLTAALTANGEAGDRLEVRNEGSGAGQIAVAGSNVIYGGTIIGSWAGGEGATPLVVTLNSAATPSATEALLRAVTYRNVSSTPSLARRAVTVTLADGDGGTSSASRSIRVGWLRLTEFQEGADHGFGVYRGAADIALSEAGPDTAWPIGRTPPPAEGLLIDWPDGGVPNSSQVLMRFENMVGNEPGQIPAGATVVSAELQVKILNPGDGGTMHRMLMAWDSTNATWDSLGGGVQQDDVESRVAFESQLGVENGSQDTGSGFVISVGVTPDVQAWVNGQANHGWVFTGWPFNTDGTGLVPSEVDQLDERPRLRVFWVPAGTSSASFRQGVNGYNGAFDTRIREPEPDTEASTLTGIFVDGGVTTSTDQDHVLIRFEDIIGSGANRIPPGARVDAAMLDLVNVIGNAMGDGGQFFALLKPWQDTTSTWNSWGSGIQADGVEAVTTPTVAAGSARLDPNVQGGFNSFDVTADVQAWASGTRPNYGWAILPWPGGTDGWGFATSEAAEERDRPRLRVYLTVPTSVPPTPIRLQPPTHTATQVQIRFSASAGTYSIQRSGSLLGPWPEIGTATVAGDGLGTYTDSTAPASAAFYRVLSR